MPDAVVTTWLTASRLGQVVTDSPSQVSAL